MNQELLARGLALLGLPESGDAFERLGRYVDAIEAWNPAYGLVGSSGDELIIKHILDSLAPFSAIERLSSEAATGRTKGEAGGEDQGSGAQTLVDLGTGAGLPGIPLAIAMPGLDVSLLDRMTRRIRFLEAMRETLSLDNVTIIEEQVERAKGSFDIVTFRAFRPFERKLFKRVFRVCSPTGFVVAYKGKADRARAELAEIEGLYSSVDIVPIKVPFLDDERCIVVMRPAR